MENIKKEYLGQVLSVLKWESYHEDILGSGGTVLHTHLASVLQGGKWQVLCCSHFNPTGRAPVPNGYKSRYKMHKSSQNMRTANTLHQLEDQKLLPFLSKCPSFAFVSRHAGHRTIYFRQLPISCYDSVSPHCQRCSDWIYTLQQHHNFTYTSTPMCCSFMIDSVKSVKTSCTCWLTVHSKKCS
jgi:hypothetical protein